MDNKNLELEQLLPYFKGQNFQLEMMGRRIGVSPSSASQHTVDGVQAMTSRLGGLSQQERLIQEKRRSLDRATLYSYQGAFVKRQIYDFEPAMDGVKEAPPVRALINPNKLKPDYDDKIISIGFEHGFRTGDVFEWCNTKTYWLIYLQDLTELAYFRGDIRRCRYELEWYDEDGKRCRTYAAVRGPVETKINFIQKNKVSVDIPNHSLHLLLPKNSDTVKKFKRYSKFYLQEDTDVCWRVEAVDGYSMPGILELNAVEYYANEHQDDVDNGIVDGLIAKPIDPNQGQEANIIGETFIKPKRTYQYEIKEQVEGKWYIDAKVPVKFIPSENTVTLKWEQSYSGQFDIWFGHQDKEKAKYKKTIVVESLF